MPAFVVERHEQGRLNFLVPVIIAVVLGQLLGFVSGGQFSIKGQSLVIVIPLVGMFLSIASWLFFRSVVGRSTLTSLALIGLGVMWMVALIRVVSDASGFNYLVIIPPVLLAMVIIKPLGRTEVCLAAKVLGAAVITAAAMAETFSLVTGRLVIPESELDYSAFQEVIGLTKRWVGPFIQENYAGPIAAYVLVFAISQRNWYRWLIGLPAVWMVVASTSSTAVLGVVVGLIVLGVFTSSGLLGRISRRLRATVAVIGFGVLAVIAALRDTSFNGRTTVWSSYLDVWQSNPIAGVGTGGIDEALRSGQIPLYWTHAHNVPLDLLVRFGVLGLLLILLVYVLSMWGAFRAAVNGVSWPLAIVVMFMIMGVMEVPGDWLTWSIPMIWLVLAILASQDSSASPVAIAPRSDSGPSGTEEVAARRL